MLRRPSNFQAASLLTELGKGPVGRGFYKMRIGGAPSAPPPSQTGQADLPHPAFRSAVTDGLAQGAVPRCSEGTCQPRCPHGPVHPVTGGPLPADEPQPSGFPPHQREQPCGTTSVLARWPRLSSQHCLPTSLRSTIITRFCATTDALTPTGPFVIACRGSLIHVTRTSHHSVSYHLRSSARRVPLPQRWPHYFVRASPFHSWLARTADRIEFTLSAHTGGPCYGLVVHFQLLSTRGCSPDAVTFSCWPYSVGQVRDFHPAVPVRSQAHYGAPNGAFADGRICEILRLVRLSPRRQGHARQAVPGRACWVTNRK